MTAKSPNPHKSEPTPVAVAPAPTPETAKPKPVLWAGGTLALTDELLQALQKGEDTLLSSGKPQYILHAPGEPSEDMLIRVNSEGAAVFRASSPDVIVPRMLHGDFTSERVQLSAFRQQEHFDFGYGLKCYDNRTITRLSEHHQRLAVGLWLVTIVKEQVG